MPKRYTAKKVRRHHRKKRLTRKRQRGGNNIKQATTEFTVTLVPINNQGGRVPIKAKAEHKDKILDFYNRLANDNETDEIVLTVNGVSLRLKDVAKNIQYSTYVHSPNTRYEQLILKVTFDVDIDSLWNNELFELPKNTEEEKRAFATELLRMIYLTLQILIDEDYSASTIIELDPIDYNNHEYIPNSMVDMDTFYPHVSDMDAFFSPYIQA